MSITIEDCHQHVTLHYDAVGRLVQAHVQKRPGADLACLELPLIYASHGLDVYSLWVTAKFEGESCWTGLLVYSSSQGSQANGLGKADILCQHHSEAPAVMKVEPGFIAWPQRPQSALAVLRVQPYQAGLWTFSHPG